MKQTHLKIASLFVVITFLIAAVFENGALATGVNIGSAATSSGTVATQMGEIAQSAGAVQSFQADLFTGRAQTSIPIFVPPGRKKIQPSLALSYSSSGGNGWLGVGWGLDLGFIARDTKKGVPKYDSTDKYVFSFQGVNSELVSVATNEYRAKDEGLFLKFIYDPTNNKWTVTDKSGTQYFFGLDSQSRQTNTSGTFKWALTKVKDTSGNYMSVTYTTDQGGLYLSQIDYNGNETQSFAHSHRVEFTLETRTDSFFSYITGYKVTTAKRLKEILVKAKDGSGTYQLARKYALAYGYSSATSRSRLTSVTEYGTDGTTSLPAVTFTYQDKPLGFESMADFSGIERANTSSNDQYYVRSTASASSDNIVADCIDLNGDCKADRVQAVSGNTVWKIQLGGNNSFGSLQDFGTLEKPTSWSGYDYVTASDADQQRSEFMDMNADGLPDRILSQDSNTTWTVQINNGTGFDATSSTWGTISRMVSSTHYDHIRYSPSNRTWVDFVDINGDGLPDRVMSEENNSTWKVQFNTGTGFTSMTDWGTTERMTSDSKRDAIRYIAAGGETRVDLVDMNGDGLPDRVQGQDGQTNWKVQWNTGSGFTTMENFGPIERLTSLDQRDNVRYVTDTSETNTDIFDINGDGLPDRVQAQSNNTVWKVQFNTGTGFTSMTDFTGIEYMDSGNIRYSYPRWTRSSGNQALDVLDLDGDGLPDRIQSKSGNSAWKLQKNQLPFPDLLSKVENGRGGTTELTYVPSTQFDNTDTNGKYRLPFPVQVVNEVKQKDGMGSTYITEYSYKGGMYDATNREFRGFRETTVTDSIGTKTITTFGQTDTLKGRPLEKQVKDVSGNLFTDEVTTWSTTNPYTGVNFTHVDTVDSYIYDGTGSAKQIEQTFTYDSYGNLASTTELGDTSISTDSRKTVNTYVYNTTDYILNTLEKTALYDTDLSTIKAEKYFYYDGASSITTAPTAGLLTKQEEWLNTASGCSSPGTCTNNPKTTMTYDSYGNLDTVTDARGYQTTNTYDSTYHLFLTQISNTLSQTRQFTYDPWIAQILTSTDANSQVTETQYDVLGRVTKVIAPLDSSSAPTQEFSYDLASTPNKTTVKVKTSIPGDTYTYLTIYTFTDGLGREIQKRAPSEDSSKQNVTGSVSYDERGLASKQWNPYLENNSTSYVAPSSSSPKATMTYDAVGRRTRIDYADGTNSQVAFNKFEKTTTDPRSKTLKYTNDAYGRLITVEEHNSGSNYTTTYEYDVLNNLKKTTDNASNQTTITYDSLSRKTAMTDPDMGSWTYTYDLNDNLSSQVDAKSQTISFTYDELNRVTLKDLPSGETDVTYVYDSAPSGFSGQTGYWVGRLAKVTDASGTHEFKYDKQGRVLEDKKTVDSTAYSFTRTYDSMGRVRTLTYPDTEVVTYTYNLMGEIETISGLKSSVTTDYMKEVNYNASGQITYAKYGNNVTSDYTYDANTLRLSNILTKKPDGTTKLQDLSYTFDNNGNVTHLADAVNSSTQDFTYDDLNRLIAATGSAYGSQSFMYNSIGNMTNKNGMTMSYSGSGAGPHAVTSVSGATLPTYCHDGANTAFTYDANGNMTQRGSDTMTYDSENRIKEVKAYDGVDNTQNYTLAEGWNVISFPFLPSNKSITSVLSSLTFGTDYDQISYWDPVSSTWKHFVNDSDFNDFSAFEFGRTYEIYVTHSGGVSFSVTGKSSGTDVTFQIKTGDNFFSPGVQSSTAVSTILSSLTLNTDYSDVKRYNTTTHALESYANSDFTNFEPGKGYIIVGLHNCSFSYGKTETSTTFVYDSTGSRVKKTSGSTTMIYFGKDYEVQGSTSTKYIFLGDRRISLKDSSGTLLFVHEDHISSSNVITDSSGNSAALYEYDPYGSTVTHTGSASVKHKFTGQEEDDTTHLYNYGARYYDPQIGKFVTADPTVAHPTDPQDLNRYSYARNNPIRFTDPTGLDIWSVFFNFAMSLLNPQTYTKAFSFAAEFLGSAFRGLTGISFGSQNLVNTAISGAATGKSGSSGAASLGGGTSSGGGASSSPQIQFLQQPSDSYIGSGAIGEIGTTGTVEVIEYNSIGITIGPIDNEVFWKSENQDLLNRQLETQILEGSGLQEDPIIDRVVGAAIFFGGALRSVSSPGVQGVYEFEAASGKTYVGQSSNIPRRIGEHIRSGKLSQSEVLNVKTAAIRGDKVAREIAEQRRIDDLGGIRNLENKVNPIGAKRRNQIKD